MRKIFVLLLAFSLASPAFANPLDEARALRKEAARLEANGDIKGAAQAFEKALQIQPGHRSYWLNLAVYSAQMGDMDKAKYWLQQFAGAGLYFAPAPLASALGITLDDPKFGPVLRAIGDNARPMGTAEVYTQVPMQDLLVEGITYDAASKCLFFSTVVGRNILAGKKGGKFSPFTDQQPALRSLFSMVVDQKQNLLWVTSGTLAQTPLQDGEKPASGLFAFDLNSKKIIHAYDMGDEATMLGDLTLGPDGWLYASDGQGAAIYRFSSNGDKWSKVDMGDTLSSPQGIVIKDGVLYVANYSTGIVRKDLNGGQARLLPAPPNTSLIGVDGLIGDGDTLIGIQNGANPKRIVRIDLNQKRDAINAVSALLQGHEAMEEPTQGVIIDNHLVFIANAQWQSFPENGKTPETARNPVQILSLVLR